MGSVAEVAEVAGFPSPVYWGPESKEEKLVLLLLPDSGVGGTPRLGHFQLAWPPVHSWSSCAGALGLSGPAPDPPLVCERSAR